MQAEIAAAYRQGFSEGERAGQAAARSESETVLQQFAAAMDQYDALADSLRKDAERQVVSLSLAVARKMVGHALTTRPEALTGLIKEALKRVADHGRIRIRVHPDHLARVQQALPSFGDVVSKLERLSVEADVAVNQGCVLETDFGELDACLETQFQVVEDLFREIDT
jgi:flagellar biosynthesis/type III secretory pathway protein FliH